MESVSFGDGLQVGRIGYGAMQLLGKDFWGPYPDHDAAIGLLRRAVDLGVTLIDTADIYGPHYSESLIRDALHPYPENLAIATKGGFVRGPDLSSLDAVGNPNYLRQCAYMSARRLGVDQLDLYYLHSGRATDASFEDQVGMLAELQRKGLIRNIGLSNVTLDQLREADRIVAIAAVTAHYNVTVRTGQDLLEEAESVGAIFSPWHPVRTHEGPHGGQADDILAGIATSHGATVTQVILAWHLHLSPRTVPIPGTTNVKHLKANVEAGSIRLDHAEMARITAAGAPGPNRPTPTRQGL